MQKKSNVLDKPVSHQKSSTTAAPVGVGNSSNNVSADIDVKKLTVRMYTSVNTVVEFHREADEIQYIFAP